MTNNNLKNNITFLWWWANIRQTLPAKSVGEKSKNIVW